jgi:hypothetical protein
MDDMVGRVPAVLKATVQLWLRNMVAPSRSTPPPRPAHLFCSIRTFRSVLGVRSWELWARGLGLEMRRLGSGIRD